MPCIAPSPIKLEPSVEIKLTLRKDTKYRDERNDTLVSRLSEIRNDKSYVHQDKYKMCTESQSIQYPWEYSSL